MGRKGSDRKNAVGRKVPKIDTFIKFAGLRRAGNHAVVNWLLPKYGDGIYYRNDVAKEPLAFHKESDQINCIDEYGIKTASWAQDKSLFFCGYEDQPLARIFTLTKGRNYSRKYVDWYGDIKNYYQVVLLRDPYNMFASRLQRERQGHKWIHNQLTGGAPDRYATIELWKDYAYEFLDYENICVDYKIPINYNEWATSEDYRRGLCARLNKPFDDKGRDLISGQGYGSSFEDKTTPGSKLDITNRWQHFKNDELYCSIFADAELRDLSEAIFGHIPGTEYLI